MSQSSNILTWMQVTAKEEAAMIITFIENHHTSMLLFELKLLKSGTDLSLFDSHDEKMTCNLTQHSKWNRKPHPFLLCKCKRGDAVRNYDHHERKMISDDE